MSGPALELHDFEVLAGTRVLVGPISLAHHPGSVLWLTGENGAGKSSFLRALARGAQHRGRITRTPHAARALCYYAPTMHFSSGVTVQDWLGLHERWQRQSHHADLVDALLPPRVAGRIVRLSTGEAKRLTLWSLLRSARRFYILDEPFEHLSPAAKITLRRVLGALALEAVVVVATNQDIPSDVPARVLELD